MLFLRYDESGDNHADNPNIKPESTTSHTEPSDDEVHIRQAYGLETNHRLPYQALQLPNEWVMSCLCVILIAPVAAAISIGILGVPNWWQAWWSSQLSTLSYAFWSFIL